MDADVSDVDAINAKINDISMMDTVVANFMMIWIPFAITFSPLQHNFLAIILSNDVRGAKIVPIDSLVLGNDAFYSQIWPKLPARF